MKLYAVSIVGCAADRNRLQELPVHLVATNHTAWVVQAESDDRAYELAKEEARRFFPESDGFQAWDVSLVQVEATADGGIRIRSEYAPCP